MWGHSMGGGIALRAMVTTSDIKAGVIWAGTVASYADLFERRWGPGLVATTLCRRSNPTAGDGVGCPICWKRTARLRRIQRSTLLSRPTLT